MVLALNPTKELPAQPSIRPKDAACKAIDTRRFAASGFGRGALLSNARAHLEALWPSNPSIDQADDTIARADLESLKNIYRRQRETPFTGATI